MHGLLIADGGSSKTHWMLLNHEAGSTVSIQTEGINPLHEKLDSIKGKLQSLKSNLGISSVSGIRYFGAGCAYPEINEKLKKLLSDIFLTDDITVESDIIGAGIALFGDGEGISCIVGTGSNTAHISKGKIISRIPSLGFILGDEGGGVSLGKRLLNEIYKGLLPQQIIDIFMAEYQLPLDELIKNVYSNPKPVPYIASFSSFIKSNLHFEEIYKLAEKEFNTFFEKNVLPYPEIKTLKVGMVGSVAYHYQEMIKNLAKNKGIVISNIIQSPINSLVNYYSTK